MANSDKKRISDLQSQLNESRNLLENYQWGYEQFEEKLSGIDLQLDNFGWSDVHGYDDEGPSLADIKKMSKQIRNASARNVWVKNGWKLRYNYVYAGGIHYSNIPGQNTTGRGRPAAAWARVQSPKNQKTFFGRSARERREGALYCDSMALYIGEEPGYTISELPINQITADYRNPDDPSEVWAYRRSWWHYPAGETVPQERVEWIFLSLHKDREVATIQYNGTREPVARNKQVFGAPVNELPGWAYGIPDAFSGLAWAKMYREALINGKTMSDALASIAYKMLSKTRRGAQEAGARFGKNAFGQTATMVDGMDMAPMSTAGRGYDYDASRPVLAAMAAGLGVSVVALSSDPGAAGSSYGSAQTLDLPTKLMSEARRQYHIDLDREVLAWLGAPEAEVWFEPIDDSTEILREIQSKLALWNSGLFTPEQMKADIESIFGRMPSEIPDGVMIPNNENSVQRRDIDTDGQVTPGAGAAPGQGQSTGAGDAPRNNDSRDDTIS